MYFLYFFLGGGVICSETMVNFCKGSIVVCATCNTFLYLFELYIQHISVFGCVVSICST